MTVIYADNAATTKMSRTAVDAMMSVMTENYGNPSSLYSIGQRAKEILEEPNKTIEEHHRGKAKKVIWISNNPEVAKVSKAGTVKGMSPGTCKVYGSAQNGRFVVVKVTVE